MDITTEIFDRSGYQVFDLSTASGGLAVGNDLRTAVILSLFSDRRAADDDDLPDPHGSRRGWWGDAVQGRRIGSRLWLLSREKETREVVSRAREYAREALAWLVSDGIANNVLVDVEAAAGNQLHIGIQIERPLSVPDTWKFSYLWRTTQVAS